MATALAGQAEPELRLVRFDSVTFGYQPDQPVLRGVDCTVSHQGRPGPWWAPPALARPAW